MTAILHNVTSIYGAGVQACYRTQYAHPTATSADVFGFCALIKLSTVVNIIDSTIEGNKDTLPRFVQSLERSVTQQIY